MSFAIREEVEQIVEIMGVLKPSQSSWASPIILVAKKDTDYKKQCHHSSRCVSTYKNELHIRPPC